MHGDAADELPCGWCLRGQHVLLIIAIRSSCHGPVSCCSAWLVSPVSVSRCAILLQATSMAQPALVSFGKQNTRQACKPYPLPCAELFRVGEATGIGVEQPQRHPGIHDGVCHSHRLQPSPRGMHQLQLLLHVPRTPAPAFASASGPQMPRACSACSSDAATVGSSAQQPCPAHEAGGHSASGQP